MREFENALWALLKTDATLAGIATSGVYKDMAPQGTEAPYLIMQAQAPFRPTYTYARNGHEDALYTVKLVIAVGTGGGMPTAAYDAQDRLQTILTDPASFPMPNGRKLLMMRPEQRVSYMETTDSGNAYRHVGWMVAASVAV